MDGAHRYRIYGLTLSSPRPLHFLGSEPDAAKPAEIALRFDQVTAPQEAPVRHARRLSVFADGTGLHEAVYGARFLIREGVEIIAEVPAGTSDADLPALAATVEALTAEPD